MHRAHADTPCIPAWLICDSVFLWRYGMGMVRPQTRRLVRFLASGYLKRARSTKELAELIGVPAAALEETVRQMNQAAETGRVGPLIPTLVDQNP
jgi:hypothetical protein